MLQLFTTLNTFLYQDLEILPEKAMAPHSSTPAWKIPWTEKPGRSLVGYSPRGRNESDTTERLHLHLHLHLPSTWIKQGIYFLSSLSRKKIDSSQVISVLVSIPLPAFCWATGRIFRFLRQGFREWKLWGKPTFQRASSFEKCWSPRRKSWTPMFI